jgi:hypothetical protein
LMSEFSALDRPESSTVRHRSTRKVQRGEGKILRDTHSSTWQI